MINHIVQGMVMQLAWLLNIVTIILSIEEHGQKKLSAYGGTFHTSLSTVIATRWYRKFTQDTHIMYYFIRNCLNLCFPQGYVPDCFTYLQREANLSTKGNWLITTGPPSQAYYTCKFCVRMRICKVVIYILRMRGIVLQLSELSLHAILVYMKHPHPRETRTQWRL